MTKLIHKTGDLFTTEADAIGHGVNVKGAMAAGIAAQFAKRYPEMKSVYVARCHRSLLHPGDVFSWYEWDRVIFNIASQENPGRDARLLWLIAGISAALIECEGQGVSTLALPQIGCGIGGLEWDEVKAALKILAEASTVDIEVWTYVDPS
jgi:O-acetyl-ADP-ribose deacetylase (regulator of RNase III)